MKNLWYYHFTVTSLRSVVIVTTQHSLNEFSSAFAAPIIHTSRFTLISEA